MAVLEGTEDAGEDNENNPIKTSGRSQAPFLNHLDISGSRMEDNNEQSSNT
mgnify:CR=1 FL=1